MESWSAGEATERVDALVGLAWVSYYGNEMGGLGSGHRSPVNYQTGKLGIQAARYP